MSVTVIPSPTGNADEQSEHPIITAFNPVASYSWLDVSGPAILVPGYCPIWSPPTDPQPIPPDTGFLYVDQNADRYPKSPISPLFAAVRGVQPTYLFASVDVISDRSPLRKLYAFAAGDPNLKDFRFGYAEEEPGEEKQAEEKQKKTTVVFHRMEKMTREEYQAGHFHGYRARFEAQYLRLDEMAKGSSSHYRISEYDFGGLKFLMRSGVDGSIPTTASTDTNLKAEDSDLDTTIITKLKIEDDRDLGKGKSTSIVQDPTTKDAEALSIIPTAKGMADQSTILEFITRSENVKSPFDIATKMPDLYLSQTPHFVEAYHHNPGWRYRDLGWRHRAPGKLTALFALADLRVRDMQEEFKEWEERTGEVLGRYLAVVKAILDVVKGKGEESGVWEVSYARGGSGLEVKEVLDGEGVVMREEVGRFFGGEEVGELSKS